ncbi:hypothetical protein BDF14DRAFT_1998995 [Spinellus fusiger]|nr:hypothetical protein BDF14DRAFT_1998995 [Spinellus fusiger]
MSIKRCFIMHNRFSWSCEEISIVFPANRTRHHCFCYSLFSPFHFTAMDICRLPNELLNEVCQLLTIKDITTSASVCHSWNNLLSYRMTRSITISTPEQFTKFYYMLICSKKAHTPAGLQIHNLLIEDGGAIRVGGEDLGILCANLRSLEIHKRVDMYSKSICTHDKSLQRATMDLLCKYESSLWLSRLHIEYCSPINICDLPPLPNINHLHLSWIKNGLNTNTLHTIHSFCPRLKTLSLCGHDEGSIDTPGKFLLINSLTLKFLSGTCRELDWFDLITQAYPHLHEIKFEVHRNENPVDAVSCIPLDTIPLAYHRFAHQARQLHSLSLINTISQPLLVALHHYQVPLQQIALQSGLGIPRALIRALFGAFPGLTQLSLKGSPRYNNIKDALDDLKNFKNLESLTLERWSPLSFSDILDTTHITHLTLEDTQILECADWSQTHLTSLVLKKVQLLCQTTEIKGKLRSLVLQNCTTRYADPIICLEGQTLSHLQVDKLCIGQELWRENHTSQNICVSTDKSRGMDSIKEDLWLTIRCTSVFELIVDQKTVNVI